MLKKCKAWSFQVRWHGPYLVQRCFSNGTYQLVDLNGTICASRVNGLRLKKYHARLMLVVKDDMHHYSDVHHDPSIDFEMDLHILFSADHK